MRRTIRIFFIFLLLSAPCLAQQKARFHISSFKENPLDLSAREAPTSRDDGTGELYAIIKVTSADPYDDLKAYSFDFGKLKHVPEMKDGELWLYVQYGAKNISIARKGYLPINRESLNTTLQPGRVYRIRLSAEAQKVVKQMVRFNISPVEAKAIIMYKSDRPGATEQLLGTADDNGAVVKNLELGKYSYKIISDNCYPSEGVLILDNANATHTEDVVLRANFARVSLVAGDGVSIFVDGDNKGAGRWNGILKEGTYSIECRKAGHKSTVETLRIEEGKDVSLTLAHPKPVTGTLSITSTPLDAAVTIDGKDYGLTPRNINDLIIGNHKVTVSKDGYLPQELEVVITENEVFERSVTLQRGGKKSAAAASTVTASTPKGHVSVPRDPLELLCIACTDKNDGSIAYFTALQWEMLPADKRENYLQIGVSIKKDGHELIVAANECRNPINGKTMFRFGGSGTDFAGVRNYEKRKEIRERFINTGLSDTKVIVEQAKGKKDPKRIEGAPAAEAAWNYKANESDRQQWYLPSCSELVLISQNRKKINRLLEKYFSSYDKIAYSLWSSTEGDPRHSWKVSMSGGSIKDFYRNDNGRVRAVTVEDSRSAEPGNGYRNEGEICGTVTDRKSLPLEGAKVYSPDGTLIATSKADGTFSFKTSGQIRSVTVEKDGYFSYKKKIKEKNMLFKMRKGSLTNQWFLNLVFENDFTDKSPYAGLMAGYLGKWGGYLKVAPLLRGNDYVYWPAVTAGVTKRLCRWMHMYLGMGIAPYQGKYYHEGFSEAIDLGFIIKPTKHFNIDIGTTISGAYLVPGIHIGLGYSF